VIKNSAASPKTKRLKRERKQRRGAIIKVAREFFAKEGYEQTMVEDVAQAAGYTKMTLYNYFRSKDDLFMAVVTEAYKKMYDIMDSYLNQADVSFELRSMGQAYLEFFNENPDDAILFESARLGVIISNLVQKIENNEELTESEQDFKFHMDLIEKLMTSVITATMERSGVRKKVDPFSVIMVLSTFAQSIRELVLRGKRSNQPEEKTREYLSVFFTIIDQGLKHYDD